MFYNVFQEVGKEYPDIQQDRMIIDIGSAKVAVDPCRFDVILAPNLYGDIISDIAAEVTGSVGLAGSANIGLGGAMFEAIHGSAPDIAGKGIANPSGLLLGAVMMLVHIGQSDIAEKIHNAWLKTIEDGIHTGDIYREGTSKTKVGSVAFGDAVVARLGQKPSTMSAITYPKDAKPIAVPEISAQKPVKRELSGVDVYICSTEKPEELAEHLKPLCDTLVLRVITNRGLKVWPDGDPNSFCVDHFRCRFQADMTGDRVIKPEQVIGLLTKVSAAGLSIIKTENLFLYDGQPGYSIGQGQ
jgi:isocitrate dehydrogenase